MEEAVVGAVVGATIQVVQQNLLSISEEPTSLIQFLNKDLEKLKSSFDMVHDILYDAGMQQVTDRVVKRWLRSLEDVAFDADNVLDEINYQLLSTKVETTQNTAMKKVQSFFSNNTILAGKLRDIIERLEIINQKAIDFGLHMRLAGARAPGPDASASMGNNSFSTDPIILGRENDVSRMVEVLITSSRAEPAVLSVLPIVGMGGLGKTTLARKVFDNEQIISHFGDNRVWVYVSRNFDVCNILKNILTSSTGEKFELETREALLKKLQKKFGTQSYLLVLDDHWDGDRDKWGSLVNSLSGISSANGNCMIVTTRSEDITSIVETLPVHKLEGLSEDECWSIIKAKAFRGGNVPLDFDAIGKNIAKKCQGLPLAAKVVGGLLFGKTIEEWMLVGKKLLSGFGNENPISGILKLSFESLSSSSLKKCFAYCSIFPKGYGEIKKEKLIELWMAEGFLQPEHQRSNITMESTGSKFFNLLLQNSLLLQVAYDDCVNETHMHDLVHDLACSVLCGNDNVMEGICRSRYIGYKPSGDGLLSISNGQERYVRTLFFNGRVSDIKFSDFESLHTLTLAGTDIVDLPTSIKELKRLRYLDISETKIRSLPDSIGELYHLQTFRSQKEDMFWEDMFLEYLEKLPDSMSCLISLRHLHISRHTALPPEIGKLTSLQTLPCFHVGGEKGCEISELGKLKYLKGKLQICNLEKVHDKNEAMSADLIRKKGMYRIKLVWCRSKDEANVDESVLEGLQPHPDLERLEIWGFKGKSLPQWTLRMAVQPDGHCCWEGLNNLMEIRLEGCSECEKVPSLGHLRNLEYLYLRGLTNVKSIRPSFYGIDESLNNISHNGVVFPALKWLELWNMPNLKEWDEAGSDQPSGEVVFPRLQYLKIERCEQLTSAPSHFPCLGELIIRDVESSIPLENICGTKLTTLTHLRLSRIQGLECLPDELFSNNRNLSWLAIWSCPRMTRLVTLILRGGGAPASLGGLSIGNCRGLRELPDDLHRLNSLGELVIDGCPNLKSIPYPSSGRGGGHEPQQQGFTSLKELRIHNCAGLTNLPIEMVESCALSLELLSLDGLASLTNISEVIGCLHKMTRLTSLEIKRVPKIRITQRGNSFERLEIGPSDLDSSWNNASFNEAFDAMFLLQPSQILITLRRLSLFGSKHWECLPDGLRHLTSLSRLSLYDFGIEALPEWFGKLGSLERLEVYSCKKLRHFPSKQAMQRLSKLTRLLIIGSPLLLKGEICNYNNNNNKSERPQIADSEWPKISHIPTVIMRLNSPMLLGSRDTSVTFMEVPMGF